jgi:hypothetical protein
MVNIQDLSVAHLSSEECEDLTTVIRRLKNVLAIVDTSVNVEDRSNKRTMSCIDHLLALVSRCMSISEIDQEDMVG